MRWYRHRGMDLLEECMRRHCCKELETYEIFKQCEESKKKSLPCLSWRA